ncbi:Uu.00g042520.m01.CDS01 [Anthostomella pinea]|uniref:Uu.00g042520.m01.CDS01 n=1 Tax=Anthostomella pinea TaxID=933095 RepID=A0AAI8VAH2_9PEZI|nr:Uu.00g042520.m01.CDS01 [Anthostomella pinea]
MAFPGAPQLIFGCGGLGNEFVGEDSVTELLQTLKQFGVSRLDTATLYPPTDIGASQRLLGRTGAARLGFTIDTKVLVSLSGLKGTLEPEKIDKYVAESNEVLRFEDGQRINVLHAHAPDVVTPLEEQAAGFDKQYKKGLFDKVNTSIFSREKYSGGESETDHELQLGLSNFPLDMLSEFIDICDREGYVKPAVYQGLYKIIDRRHEGPLLDFVHKQGMQFVAHSPLASGFLHGRLTTGDVEGTRFAEGNIMSMDARRYDTDKHHDIIRSLDKVLEPHGITKTDAALRWLAYHSQLTPQDGIIFGSSKLAQAKQNVAAIGEGPLPADVLVALDSACDTMASHRTGSYSEENMNSWRTMTAS